MKPILYLIIALSVSGCAQRIQWTEAEIRVHITEHRHDDWYPVQCNTNGTTYLVHTWDGKPIKAPQ